jgi:hypothetical protein
VVSKPEGYVGTLAVTWENGEKNVFEIAQSKGHIWVGEHFVSARNETSMQGVLREISDVMSYPPKKVKQYTWLELIGPIKFTKV